MQRARAGIELNVARPADALALSQAIIDEGPDDLATARARPTIAAALAMLGRCDEALALVDQFLPTAFEQLDTSPLIAVQLLTARNGAFMRLGRVAESRALADQCLAVALVGESIDGTAVFESWAGRARLAAGDIQGARRHLIEAEALFAERDPLGMRPLGVVLERAGERLGRRPRGRAPCARRRRVGPALRSLLRRRLPCRPHPRSRPPTAACATRPTRSPTAVAWATAPRCPSRRRWSGTRRYGSIEPRGASNPWRDSRTLTNPFVAALAAHAHASASDDPAALEVVAATFEAAV